MLHEPALPAEEDPAEPYKVKLGIWMFLFYLLFYVIFVAINLISPLTMGNIVAFGLNLATVYGMILIIAALLEALVYNVLCNRKEAELAHLIKSHPKVAAVKVHPQTHAPKAKDKKRK